MRSALLRSSPGRGKWRNYTPIVDATTTPWNLGANPTARGRFFYDRETKLVHADMAIAAGISPVTGAGYLLASLPIPARNQGAILVGSGYAQHGLYGLQGMMPLGVLLSQFAGTVMRAENLVQFACSDTTLAGTVSGTSVASYPVTFTTPLSFAPSIGDIAVVPITTMGTVGFYISGVSASGFTINATNAGNFSFAWKVRMNGTSSNTSAYIYSGSTSNVPSPFAVLGASGDVLAATVTYEALQ